MNKAVILLQRSTIEGIISSHKHAKEVLTLFDDLVKRQKIWAIDVCFFVIYSGKFLQYKCTGLPGSPDLLCTLHVLQHNKTIYTFEIDIKMTYRSQISNRLYLCEQN